jgi:hypothetical protein
MGLRRAIDSSWVHQTGYIKVHHEVKAIVLTQQCQLYVNIWDNAFDILVDPSCLRLYR